MAVISVAPSPKSRGKANQAHNQKPPKTPAVKGAFGRPLAVPTARKLAREHQIALEDIAGSSNGRIRQKISETISKHLYRQ
ncbi:MAG: E3 binding domain-containing protein [Deinococcales bacterium]